jgi:hypothetical protein
MAVAGSYLYLYESLNATFFGGARRFLGNLPSRVARGPTELLDYVHVAE